MAEQPEQGKEEKKEESEILKKFRGNPWILSTIIIGIVALILLVFVFRGGITGNVISEDKAMEKTADFIGKVYGVELEEGSVMEKNGIYEITFSMEGQPVKMGSTKDFSFMRLPNGYWIRTLDFEDAEPAQQQEQEQPAEVPKSDNPEVELFVMTHCPYGTQAEKGILPVMNLLDNIKIRFVHYFMHGEEEQLETYRQLCIREEQEDKFLKYLQCFLEAGESENCLGSTGVNKGKVESCMGSKAEGYYAEDSALSEGYGVRGSPSLVINGQVINSGRSSAAFLSTICSAFNEEPSACSEELSNENPSAGFGYSTGGDTGAAQCG